MHVIYFLRLLLSTKNKFLWTQDVDQALFNAKRHLASAPTLAYFDPKKPTRLCTEASRQVSGFALQQLSDNDWVLGQAGFCFISETESRYAIINPQVQDFSGWPFSLQNCHR